MSRMVRRLAAVAVIAVVLGAPGLSFAAPVEHGPSDSQAGAAGSWDVLGEIWIWIGSVFGQDGSSGGGQGSSSAPESNAEDEDPPGGGGDAGGGLDPGG